MNGRKLVKGDPRTQAISRAGAEATRITFQRRRKPRLTLGVLACKVSCEIDPCGPPDGRTCGHLAQHFHFWKSADERHAKPH